MFKRSTSSTTKSDSALGRKGMTPSVIAADMNVLGNIVSEGMLDIDGKIDGNVRCHTISVRENGVVRGDVVAEIAYIAGTVEGLVKAKTVTCYASARVSGTLMHESLTIEDGAFIDGKLKRTDRISLEDQSAHQAAHRLAPPTIESQHFHTNDNDEPATEAERIVLENLRLIR